MTSNACWKIALHQALVRTRPSEEPARVAVLGIGQALAGDDGLGGVVARRLRARATDGHWLIIDAGAAPEACTGTLRRFRPHLVVLIDAIEMGAEPGATAWLDTWGADAMSASTHGVPLNVLADYLRSELECSVGLLGVQPAIVEFGRPLSDPVRHAARSLVSGIVRLQRLAARPRPVRTRAPRLVGPQPHSDSASRREGPAAPE